MPISGFSERTKGKVAVGGIAIGGAAPHAGGMFVLELPITVTAVAATDFIASVPLGATIMSASFFTSTAFGAATNAFISMGVSAGDGTYVALATTSVKALGIVNVPLLGAAAAALLNMPAPPNLFIRLAQTGAASATGAGSLLVNFTT